ncbi:MAG: SprB repeat-containing protein [Flavobacteriales bacterium]
MIDTIKRPDSLQFNESITNVTCKGACDGEIDISSASGGTPPYLSSLNGGAMNSTMVYSNLCADTHEVVLQDDNLCSKTDSFIITEPDTLSTTISGTQPTCVGACNGEVTASVSGGSSPYSYSWKHDGNSIGGDTNTIDSACVGTYTVEVTDDNGCTARDTFELTATNPINITIDSTQNSSCGAACDGSIFISSSGGNTPHTYDWLEMPSENSINITQEDAVDTLCSGNYAVEVTDQDGCVDTSSTQSISDTANITGTISMTPESCPGACDGELSVSASGGTPPYSYEWKDSDGNVVGVGDTHTDCPGEYCVTITDDVGCQSAPICDTIEAAVPITATTDSTPVQCNGDSTGSATVNPSGGQTPYTYSWNDPNNQTTQTADSLAAGTYNVTVTDANNCTLDTSVTVTEPSNLSGSFSITDITCRGDCDGMMIVSPSGGVGDYSFQWKDSLGNNLAGETDDTLSDVCAAEYCVEISDSNNCDTIICDTINAPDSLLISEVTSSHKDVSCNGLCDGELEVTATGGTTPYQYRIDGGSLQGSGSFTGLCDGTYLLEVVDANGCIDSMNINISEPSVLSASEVASSHVDVQCNGNCTGELEATATGGTTPYEYSIDGGSTFQDSGRFVGLRANTYDVIVNDSNDCEDTVQIVISEPASLILNEDSSEHKNVSCKNVCDGQFEGSASGGVGGYEFKLEGGSYGADSLFTGLCDSTYNLIVRDTNNCTDTLSITISEPDSIDIQEDLAMHKDASCKDTCDGQLEGSASGGVGGYMFALDDTGSFQSDSLFNSLCAATYNLKVKDTNNCRDSIDITINEPAAISISFVNVSHNSCPEDSNGTATADVTGGISPYNYQWNDPDNQTTQTADNLPVGTWTVTVTDDSACQNEDSVTINGPAAYDIDTSTVDVSCNGSCNGEAIVNINSGGTPPYDHKWNTSPLQTGSGNDDTADGLCAGTYTDTISDNAGCSTTRTLTVDDISSIDVTEDSINHASCKDSCDGNIGISVSGGTSPYSYAWIEDATGDTVDTIQDADSLCAGDYNLTVTDANGCTFDSTFTINEPSAITLTDNNIQDATCGVCDGSADVSASGGNGSPFTYTWSPLPANSDGQGTGTVDSLCPDVYTIDVEDTDGCTEQFTRTISNIGGETIVTDSVPTTCNDSCDGVATMDTTCSDPGCTVEWEDSNNNTIATGDTSITDKCAGEYFAKITNASGCITIEKVTILNRIL